MGQAELPPDEELGRLALLIARRFINRWDMYPKQIPDGRYVTIHEPLTSSHLLAHLRGEMTLGTYILDRQSQARFVVLDVDDEVTWQRLKHIAPALSEEGIPSYLEESRRGGHLWLFLAQAVPGQQVRSFGMGILKAHGLETVELFPKQERLATGPGSLVRLPFGVHQKSGQRYGFYTPTGDRLAPTIRLQIQALSRPLTVSEAGFEAYRSYAVAQGAPPSGAVHRELDEATGETVIDRIKTSISVYDFVSQYVKLNDRGQGLCPFHDDHHLSFSVNQEENYWHCFACDIGGSVIDFWLRYNSEDFATTVKELAEMLL